jgi:predicted RNase H-like HicB family nuclease
MGKTFTARYDRSASGYVGQLVEWPQVITEGATLEECKNMLVDAAKEMIATYKRLRKAIPDAAVVETLLVEDNTQKTGKALIDAMQRCPADEKFFDDLRDKSLGREVEF